MAPFSNCLEAALDATGCSLRRRVVAAFTALALAVAYVITRLATVVFAPVLALAALFWAGYLYVRDPGGHCPGVSRN